MSSLIFPTSLRPIVSKGYGQTRGGNISRTNVQGGMPRQSRDTYYDSVPISVTLVTGALGRQAFWSFITKADGGASSFQMNHDTGLGIQPHNVLITSTISETTQDGLNWVIQFTATAERTAIQDSNCLTENLPDLYGCYGDGLNCFLDAYEQYCTSYPFLWDKYGPPGYASINMQALTLDSRVVYSGPQVYYINRAGLLERSWLNEWPLTFVGGVAVGRAPPESSAFNGLRYSSDFNQATWVKVSATAGLSGVAPDGTTSNKITPTATSGIHEAAQGEISPLATGDLFTTSVFFKSAGQTVLQIRWTAGAAGTSASYQNFDAATLQTAGNALSATMVDVGGGWLRATATVLLSGTGATKDVAFGVLQAIGQVRRPTWTGDGINGLLLWGAQVEKGDHSSSPIRTTSALVTRAAAIAKVFMNGAVSIDVRYSDGSSVNVPAIGSYATIPQANTAWGSKYITRIDFNV